MQTPKLDRLRVATLQYFIRPVKTFDQFCEQEAWIAEGAIAYQTFVTEFCKEPWCCSWK